LLRAGRWAPTGLLQETKYDLDSSVPAGPNIGRKLQSQNHKSPIGAEYWFFLFPNLGNFRPDNWRSSINPLHALGSKIVLYLFDFLFLAASSVVSPKEKRKRWKSKSSGQWHEMGD
jgi:hypothetical protein